MSGRPSIHEVAGRAGVSVTTVSHALSGNRPVSPGTRARVIAAMEALGYQPNRAARALKTGQHQTIGVYVPDITNEFFAELAMGAEQTAWAAGFSTMLGNTGFDRRRETAYLEVAASGSIDGLIYIAGSTSNVAELARLNAEIPIVLADEEIGSDAFDLVIADHRRGGALVGEHLTTLGHDVVLVVTGPKQLRSSDDRLVGFTDRFAGRTELVEGTFRLESGYDAVMSLPPGRSHPYTAVFALNDVMALGAIRALDEQGVRLPDDVAVVGYDDVAAAAIARPPLTTVRQPAFEIGRRAAERLLERIVGRSESADIPTQRELLPVELVVRESTVGQPTRVEEN